MNSPDRSSATSRWVILASLCIATFMSTLDMSIVNVALATIARDFAVEVKSLQWVVVTYALTMVALLPIAGRASDMLGRARTFTWGFLVFIGGSLLCTLAWSLPSLAAFRVVQAIGAAMLQGNSQAIIAATFPAGERGRAFGAVGSTVSAGIITGPVLGGLLTAWLGWRSIFWVNVPIGLAGFLVGRAFLPRDPRPQRQPFDFAGAAAFAAGAVLLMAGLSAAAERPWTSPVVAGSMAGGAALLVAFALWQRRAPAPLMPPAVFKSPGVVAGMTAAFISFSAGFASIFLTPYIIQNGLGFSTAVAGLVMTASPAAMLFMAPVSGYLSDRFGPRPFTLAGLALAAAGLYLLSGAAPDWGPLDFYWRIMVLGTGWGLFNTPNTATIMSAVPPQVVGVTGGLNALVRNTASTAAVAIAAAVFTWASGGGTDPAAYLAGYRTTLLAASAGALAGLIPAALRTVPPRAGGAAARQRAGL